MRYFPGLNALRLYAAVGIVAFHADEVFPNGLAALFLPGGDSVYLFFVLSGFLIGGRLIDDREHGGVDPGRFYARRIRRILPLYYATVFFGFVLIPLLGLAAVPDLKVSVFALIMMGNIAPAMGYHLVWLMHLWSIAVEEQFYLLAPVVIGLFHPLWVAVGVIGVKAILWTFALDEPSQTLLKLSPFEVMAEGVIMAWLIRHSRRVAEFVKRPFVLGCVLGYLALYAMFGTGGTPFLDSTPYALLIAGVGTSNLGKRLDRQPFHYLGSITYCVYMVHYPLMRVTMGLTSNGLLFFGLLLSLSFGIAALSWRYFERPIMDGLKRYKPKTVPAFKQA